MTRLHRALQNQAAGPLLGAAIYSYDPMFLEISGLLGFKAIWIEMEHGHITFAEAADLCRMASGHGLLTMIRIPDTRRENVLKACECGPDIIDVPMANDDATLHELVRWARFAPQGERGFFGVSRAVNYGLVPSVPGAQARLNEDLCLMGQVETREAVESIEQLCSVPGVDIFIGPADLSASMGLPGQTANPAVQAAATHVITTAKAHGKLVAVGANPQDVKFWIAGGVDVLFCANNTTCLKIGAQSILHQVEVAREELAAGKR